MSPKSRVTKQDDILKARIPMLIVKICNEKGTMARVSHHAFDQHSNYSFKARIPILIVETCNEKGAMARVSHHPFR